MIKDKRIAVMAKDCNRKALLTELRDAITLLQQRTTGGLAERHKVVSACADVIAKCALLSLHVGTEEKLETAMDEAITEAFGKYRKELGRRITYLEDMVCAACTRPKGWSKNTGAAWKEECAGCETLAEQCRGYAG